MTSALHAFGDQRPPIALRSPADLIAATPYLLGFHPTDSVVVVGFRDDRLTFVARGDLPDPGTPPETAAAALLELVSRQEIDAIVLVGYPLLVWRTARERRRDAAAGAERVPAASSPR